MPGHHHFCDSSVQGHDSSNYNGIIICIEDSVDRDQLTDLDQYCFQKLIY